MILEYKMDRGHDGALRKPAWVENGGYVQNPDDFTMMGFSPSVREYKIPDSVLTMTVAEAKTRAQNIHTANPFKHEDGTEYTTTEVDDMVQALIDANDIA